ncbi:hypothetical protein V2G26_015446 [Clonostachys chloroleuca]
MKRTSESVKMTDVPGTNLPSPTTSGPESSIFFKPDEPLGEFCQWYPAKFTVSKAEMSALVGHPVDSDDPEGWQPIYFSWDEIKSEVVVAGNMGKFGQNRRLRSLLLSTGDRVLAEAASQDRVWGIGFTAREAMALQKPELWGEIRLGKALMEVRRRLREDEEQ